MITKFEYTPQEIECLYSEVEKAVTSNKPLDLYKVSEFIKPGDFYMCGLAANGLTFAFNGLKWLKDGRIYTILFQPYPGKVISPEWYPVISVNDRDGRSSGNLSMVKKENRYIPAEDIKSGWIMRTLKT